ncbi:MAG: hypothetical protein SWH78_07165 [Thermodesulfobacteriota bacterium]|nr:hypothetical protein [Thermodesulfobacteriota bacterium]
MDRTVILTSGATPNEALGGWLKRLFPECQIEMVCKEDKPFQQSESHSSSKQFRTTTIGRA